MFCHHYCIIPLKIKKEFDKHIKRGAILLNAKALSGLLLFSLFFGCNELPENKSTDIANIENFKAAPAVVEKSFGDLAELSTSMQEIDKEVNAKKVLPTKRRIKIKKKKVVAKAKITKPVITDTVQTKKAAVNKTVIELPKSEEALKKPKFTSTLDMTFNTDNKAQESDDKTYSVGTWIFLRYALSSEYTARLWIDVEKDMAQSYETKIKDTKITFSKKGFELGAGVKFSPSVTTVLPTSEKSKRNEELQLGIEVNPTLSYKLAPSTTLQYLPRMVKNFHEYETSRTNAVNTEYKLIQFYVVNHKLDDQWYMEPAVIYSNNWSYKGTRRDPSYLTQFELGYKYTDKLTFAAGTLTGGSIFERDKGADTNIEVYDRDITTYYAKFILDI